MATKKYEDMTIAELETANQAFMAEKDAIRAKQKELTVHMDRKQSLDEAQRKVGSLSSTQKAALHQVLEAEAIPSQEEVGTP